MGLPGAAAPQGLWGSGHTAAVLSPRALHSRSAPGCLVWKGTGKRPCCRARATSQSSVTTTTAMPQPCPARIRLTRQKQEHCQALVLPTGSVTPPYLAAPGLPQHGFLPRGREFSHSNWPKRYGGEDVIRGEQALKPEDSSNYREPIPLQQSQPRGNAGRIFQRGLRATEVAYPLCPQEK